LVVVPEEFVIRVVQNNILVLLYYVESVKNIYCVIYAPLDVFEHRIVTITDVVGEIVSLLLVLLDRLEVVELLENVVCNLRTGHIVGISSIFVILVVDHQRVQARLLVLLQTKLSNPLDHSL
jgi:hypothetical protein